MHGNFQGFGRKLVHEVCLGDIILADFGQYFVRSWIRGLPGLAGRLRRVLRQAVRKPSWKPTKGKL